MLIVFIMKCLTLYEGKHRVGLTEDVNWSKNIIFPIARSTPSKQLRIVTWRNYLPEDVFSLFTEKYGTEVVVIEVTSNEEMLELLENSPAQYDIFTPGDYMVTKMINNGLLHLLDHDNLPNMEILDEDVRRSEYDRGLQYGVPLFRASLGIVFNINYVSGIPRDMGFIVQQIRNDYLAFRTGVVKEMRYAMGFTLMYLGFSPNTTKPEEITEARDLLIRMVEKYGLQLMGDEADDEALAANDILLGVDWNGTAAQALLQNPDIRFLLPEGEVLVTIDNAVINAMSKEIDTAELFINFLLIPEVAARMSNYNNYSSCVTASLPFIKRVIRNGPGFLFPNEQDRQFLVDIGDNIKLYEDAWAEVLKAKPPDSLIKLPLPKGGLFLGGSHSSEFRN